MSSPSVSICLAFVAFCSVVTRALALTFSCIVVPCACSVFVALLAWRCRLNCGSLVVLGVSSLSQLHVSGLSAIGA